MKYNLYIAAVLLCIISCTKPEPEENLSTGSILQTKEKIEPTQIGDPLSKTEVDNIVVGLRQSKGDFHWEWVDLKTVWSAIQHSDQTVAIGYKPHYEGDISSKIHALDLSKGEYKSVHDALISFIVEEANKQSATKLAWNDLLVEDDPILPILTIRTSDKHLLTALYNLKNVRYIEPLDYRPASPNKVMSTSGCSPSTEPLNSADYTTITPNAVLPWNFSFHNVSQAWSLAQGSGITVGVIDAGLSSAQPLLGSQFNNGDSNVGRTVLAEYTFGTSAYTGCSHGNSMSAQAVGPRNNQGAATGVAYKSNLYFIRGCEDVVLDLSSERTAVKNACTRLGNNRDVKVISMSIGTPFSSSVLKDGVDYAYGKGKLIMAAAGTSLDFTTWYGVIYPAAYASCVAVTGIKDNGSTCASCHDGSQVMYTIVMERAANSNRNSLALPPSGTAPNYIGGSSSATATAAGIAAVVWSARPRMTRAQLMNCLTSTSQFYPTRNSSKGFGNLNALAATNFAIANY
ncbi:MAG: S8 family serine peptidase [Arcticibacter sp.]